MPDPIKTYYLRITVDLSRELRHHCIEADATMNEVIVKAVRRYLEAARQSATERSREGQLR